MNIFEFTHKNSHHRGRSGGKSAFACEFLIADQGKTMHFGSHGAGASNKYPRPVRDTMRP